MNGLHGFGKSLKQSKTDQIMIRTDPGNPMFAKGFPVCYNHCQQQNHVASADVVHR